MKINVIDMTLTNDDFNALDAMFDRKLAPIQTELQEVKAQIATINDKLDRIEKWIPLDNTYVISPLRQAVSRA